MTDSIDARLLALAAEASATGWEDGFWDGWRFAYGQFEALFIAQGLPDAARFVRDTVHLAEAQSEANAAAAAGQRRQ